MRRPGRWASSCGAEVVGEPAHARTALTRGMAFLAGRQDGDGGFRDFATLAGEAVDWTTAYVAEGLREGAASARALGPAVTRALDQAAALLAARRRPGLGWGYTDHVPADADSSAWAVLFLARFGGSAALVSSAAESLAAEQDVASGGFATYSDPGALRRYMGLAPAASVDGWCAAHPSVTATAGRALRSVHPHAPSSAQAAWRHLEASAEPAGAWRSYWWTEPFYPTAEAVALALELGLDPSANPTLRRAMEWLQSRRDGQWGFTLDSGEPATVFSTAAALRALAKSAPPTAGAAGGRTATLTALRDGLSFLCRTQQRDGGWPSEPILRIPTPSATVATAHDGSWREGGLGAGALIRDHRRLFGTATCVAAIGAALKAEAQWSA